jgi:putative transposase
MQWQALTRCFGAPITIHATFQRLSDSGFFANFFMESLEECDQKIGLDLARRTGDCAHVKSPLGKLTVGPSPVDRKKQGSKRSIVTDGDGIMLACIVAGGNRNDAKLLDATLDSVPEQYQANGHDQIWLNAIYDTRECRNICFYHNLRSQISPHPRRKHIEPVRSIQKGVRLVVERTHSFCNRFRRLLVRFDKPTENHRAFIYFAASINTFSKVRVSG